MFFYIQIIIIGTLKKLMIDGFKAFMCFIRSNGKIFAAPLSILNSLGKFIPVDFKIKNEIDKRKTRMSLERKIKEDEGLKVMGSQSLKTLLTRFEYINIFNSNRNYTPMDIDN